jgi:hypothetical protein
MTRANNANRIKKMTFTKGQTVRGKAFGKFIVVDCKFSKTHGCEVVTLNEVSPEGFVSSRKTKLTADCLIAE